MFTNKNNVRKKVAIACTYVQSLDCHRKTKLPVVINVPEVWHSPDTWCTRHWYTSRHNFGRVTYLNRLAQPSGIFSKRLSPLGRKQIISLYPRVYAGSFVGGSVPRSGESMFYIFTSVMEQYFQ